ncbi:SPOR domain-containing protein [Thiospirillum jenense]|uniref:SPOR domain-containing protein n=1 Tax=Thiospirillum jenense TaxID=1653858 RepID=A0A839HGP5_9GAMM|nr:SPOR domain-containing protein [Thiospirillum jenense]MBB1126436.1 SPOR domain-containing protein [Thiospirillum jenense]
MNSGATWVISGAVLVIATGIHSAPPPTILPLPHPSINPDPRWVNQLPSLILPLPKPAAHSIQIAPLSIRQAPPSELLKPESNQPITPLNPAFASELLAADWPPLLLENDPLDNNSNEPNEAAEMIKVLETTAIGRPRSQLAPTHLLSPIRSRYRWHVQLLAGRSLERVKVDQRTFVQRYGFLLQGLTLTISQSRYGDVRDEFYRLRAIEWSNKASAVDWCHQLRTNGHQCFVTRITLPATPVITP